ncbi:hypothetical protein [Sphingobium terrigena]|uniref:hypothetical protein n=1 Tax=Sphingobium terrigena TaxID=2304063 RepID=UPI0016027137|nr:hypothetical protein [Sphingobium terrigena]
MLDLRQRRNIGAGIEPQRNLGSLQMGDAQFCSRTKSANEMQRDVIPESALADC